MRFIPSTWIKICSFRTDFKKISSLIAVLVLAFPLFSHTSSNCVVICKGGLNVSLDPVGQAIITPSILLEDASCDPNDFVVDITDPSGTSFGNVLTCEHVGLTMTATVTQISNGNFCQTSINVGDYINPQLTCSDTFVLCNQSVDPSVTGYPLATDNCTVFANTDLTYVDEFMDLGCFTEQGTDTITAQIQRTWSVQDESGNVGTCIQMIYLKRVTLDDVMFPAHLDGFAAPALECGQDPMDLSLTGKPYIEGISLDNAGHCELIISSSDQIVPLCGDNSYRILRTWTVVDFCSGDFTLNVQVINVEDNIAPVIDCPTALTVGTSANDCTATVNFPLTTANDECSGVTITPSWAFGTGYGPFLDIPLGTYPVTYTATDDCGNTASCTTTITVVDNVPPTPVCDYSIQVDLSVFGSAVVYASSFDSGSHDNCGVESIEVSRDGINFDNFVSFNCTDIENSPISITLRITDEAGNYNECTVNTTVDDKLNPAIACPSDVYIACWEDPTDLNVVGAPIVDDNCMVDTFYYSDIENLNECNEGSITRTWTVIDHAGNQASCIQTIYLEDNTPLIVIFPDDYVTALCVSEVDTSISGAPYFVNADCENISQIYTDELVAFSPSCYRILRTWSVYEWCTYDPNSGTNEGFWTDVQVIDVEDFSAPELTCLPDTTIDLFAADCSGVFITLEAPIATDCNPGVSISNNSPYASNSGADASGFYPPGTHTIVYTATDGCGNFTACSQIVNIIDAKAPTVICNGGININIGQNGQVEITPAMLDLGSYDNCSEIENLQFTVSPNIFTCDDLGVQNVSLTVIDEAGNSATCNTIVTIQDNGTGCSDPVAMISGVIENENGVPVQLVDIELSGGAQDFVSNDETGYFEFSDVPLNENYEIRPIKDIDYMNGVSTFDLVFMQRHILGIQPISSPFRMIAADVNASGSISTFDLVKLRRLILQLDTAFIENTSWRFVDAAHVFPNPSNPFLSSFPESITVNNLEGDLMDADFVAIKIGDVNGNANPAEFDSPEHGTARADKDLQLSTHTLDFEADEMLEVPIYAQDIQDILGFQMTINFAAETLEYMDVDAGSLENLQADHFNLNRVEEGLIAMSWTKGLLEDLEEEEAIFVLKFRAKEGGNLQKVLNIDAKWLSAEAYSSEMQILGINFEFYNQIEAEKEQFMLYKNYPNPVIEQTTVPMYLPESMHVTITIVDAAGRITKEMEQNYDAGLQKIIFTRSDFGTAGVYFLKVELQDGTQQSQTLIVQ